MKWHHNIVAHCVALALACSNSTSSFGKYVASGQIEGVVCRSYLIFDACHDVQVDAVRGTDGKLYTVRDEFDSVDEYNEGSSLCFVRIKHDNWFAAMKAWINWFAYIFGYDWQQTFLTKNSRGEFDRVDPEYLRFKCSQQE
jgi:hypothetical protein